MIAAASARARGAFVWTQTEPIGAFARQRAGGVKPYLWSRASASRLGTWLQDGSNMEAVPIFDTRESGLSANGRFSLEHGADVVKRLAAIQSQRGVNAHLPTTHESSHGP